jgi:hypothetical protein
VSYRLFKDLFRFEENERSKKQLKRDYRAMEQNTSSSVKFKHLLDHYLHAGASEQFGETLKQVDAKQIVRALYDEDGESDGEG